MGYVRKPDVGVFVVLDLDRCLFDTDRFVASFYGFLGHHDATLLDYLRARQREIEMMGGSYDIYSSIEHMIGTRRAQHLLADFMDMLSQDGVSYMLPGARRLLDNLHRHGLAWGIMTYGGAKWQWIKLQTLPVQGEMVSIVDSPQKGSLLARMYQDDGYELVNFHGAPRGNIRARNVLLVDDKAIAFEGLRPDALGVHVTSRPEKRYQSGIVARQDLVTTWDYIESQLV